MDLAHLVSSDSKTALVSDNPPPGREDWKAEGYEEVQDIIGDLESAMHLGFYEERLQDLRAIHRKFGKLINYLSKHKPDYVGKVIPTTFVDIIDD